MQSDFISVTIELSNAEYWIGSITCPMFYVPLLEEHEEFFTFLKRLDHPVLEIIEAEFSYLHYT